MLEKVKNFINQNTSEEDLKISKAGLLLSIVLYPAWGALISFCFPEYLENTRWVPAIFSGLILSMLMMRNKFVIKNISLFFLLSAIVMNTHYFYLSKINDFKTVYALGLFIVISATISLLYNNLHIAFFSLFYSYVSYDIGQYGRLVNPVIDAAIVFSIVVFLMVNSYLKIRLNKQKNIALDEAKYANEKLALSSKMATLGEVSAGIGHEINNPLMIITGSVEYLEMKFPNLTQEKSFNLILDQVERVSKITKSLKMFSTNANSEKENSKVTDIISSVETLVSQKIKKTEVLFKVINQLEFDQVYTCQSEIVQILVNLINNATDAVSGLEEKTVKLSIFKDSDNICFEVEDSGKGIPKKVKERMFDPFFTTKGPGKGTGLGLSISKKLAMRNGGDLNIKDTEKTTFVLKIPC